MERLSSHEDNTQFPNEYRPKDNPGYHTKIKKDNE